MTVESEIILEANQVSLKDSLGLTEILKKISFQIKSRDRVVIIGASGSGKTSLLRLLNRLVEATTGTLFFDGQSYTNIPVFNLRKQVVLVPQEPKLLGMTVKETLAYPLSLQQLPQSEIKACITTYCEQLHLPESWYDKTELQLSLGQRQLVTITRGLMMQPKVLLLDEPTSALDIGIATRVIDVLKAQGITVLMVNHQLDLAEKFCDRVFYLQQGELIKDVSNVNLNWQQLKEELITSEQEMEQEWT